MAPKAAKGGGGSAEVLIHEDCFTRAMKIKEANLKPAKPKGDLTVEDLSLPPILQSTPDFKAAVEYFGKSATIHYSERNAMKWPTDAATLSHSKSDFEIIRKNKKDVQDVFKFLKGQVKLAEKTKKAYFKQFEKCETKNEKRKAIVKQIADTEEAINNDLRQADDYAKQNRLFALQYLYGSKLGSEAPGEKVAVVVENSDKMATWLDPAKEDVMKFMSVIEKGTETFNMFLFHSAGVTPYQPTYTPTFSKKGSADCMKWLTKQYTPKAAAGAPWPPDWLAMTEHLCKEKDDIPSHIYIVCSKAPMGNRDALNRVAEARALHGMEIPVTIVSYDPENLTDFNQECYFRDYHGPAGKALVDTSKRDMEVVDKTLADVKKKKKQLEKFNKKLDKMEDLSENLDNFKVLLHHQNSLESLARNDFALAELATKTPAA